jgi:hypothetical protein
LTASPAGRIGSTLGGGKGGSRSGRRSGSGGSDRKITDGIPGESFRFIDSTVAITNFIRDADLDIDSPLGIVGGVNSFLSRDGAGKDVTRVTGKVNRRADIGIAIVLKWLGVGSLENNLAG